MSDHFDGVRFFNPGQNSTDRSMAELLRWKTGGGRVRWPTEVPLRAAAKPDARVTGLRVTMVGHASVLIQIDGRNLLVDPVWSERASPVAWGGPKRVNAPGIAFEDLPPIDAVLVTHNHYDHCDLATLRRLAGSDAPRFVTPLGNDVLLREAVAASAIATGEWGDTVAIDANLRATIVAAHHWSARGLGDARMALWCGFVIQSGEKTVYHSGDTGYGDGQIFGDIRTQFGEPDVAILPIGAYAPRWFMKDQHVDPGEAVQIMLDCGARQGLGIHWGTFPLADDGYDDARTLLGEELRRRNIAADRFLALQPGDVWKAEA